MEKRIIFERTAMERINKIIKHRLFREYIEKIRIHEQDRIFCKHDTIHFLDVCRLAEIDWLNYCMLQMKSNSSVQGGLVITESTLQQINRELLYAAGLLHDIGRWQEYETGVRHEISSAELAPGILKECGFLQEEIEKIVYAIINHRNSDVKEQISLAGFLYRADKKSRPCYFCGAEKECDWSATKKNLELK